MDAGFSQASQAEIATSEACGGGVDVFRASLVPPSAKLVIQHL